MQFYFSFLRCFICFFRSRSTTKCTMEKKNVWNYFTYQTYRYFSSTGAPTTHCIISCVKIALCGLKYPTNRHICSVKLWISWYCLFYYLNLREKNISNQVKMEKHTEWNLTQVIPHSDFSKNKTHFWMVSSFFPKIKTTIFSNGMVKLWLSRPL